MKIQVSKSYHGVRVLNNLSLTLGEGEILCVLGESGGGKTTLLNILAGLIPYEGVLEDVPKTVGYAFQEHRLLPNLTVEQNLQYAGGRGEDIEEMLVKTELISLKNKRPSKLSGGEKQRVSLARAFLSNAPLLLMDEPFSSLDTGLKIRLAKVLARLWEGYKPTMVFVTHDLEEALMLGHRIVVLKKGEIAADFSLSDKQIPRAYGAENPLRDKILSILTE